jgi:hypothetical protein
VGAGCNSPADLVDMLLHGFGVGMRHDDCIPVLRPGQTAPKR